ncbi:hypothetical protein AALP_AA4G155100 [Arabis alpina]|uniref:Uncharacterized protein n=1 Tax=Arabis alpina TaxID=50452 RepID=A0A087H3H3_ARAAL|nr:hypothetical protein AALP_AA4G155100 [Arabis alpina]
MCSGIFANLKASTSPLVGILSVGFSRDNMAQERCSEEPESRRGWIKQNFDVFDWSIRDDMLSKFSEIEQGRSVRGMSFVHETSPYKTLQQLWDGEI